MELYSDTLDPSETRDFTFDWSSKLASGENVTSQTVTFIAAAGTTSPSNSVASNISRVWLTGGTAGQRAIWTIAATTNQGRTFEESFGVDIVDSVDGPAALSEADTLRAELVQVRAGRLALMTGGIVQKVRNGRYATEMWYATASLADYDRMIATLEREIAAAENVAAGGRRRMAIGTFY